MEKKRLVKKGKFRIQLFFAFIFLFIIVALVNSNKFWSFMKNYIGIKLFLIIVLAFFVLLYLYQKFNKIKKEFGERVYFGIFYYLTILIIHSFFHLGFLVWFLIPLPISIMSFIRAFKMVKAIKENKRYKFLLNGVQWIDHIKNPALYKFVIYFLFFGSIILFLASIFFLVLFIESIF